MSVHPGRGKPPLMQRVLHHHSVQRVWSQTRVVSCKGGRIVIYTNKTELTLFFVLHAE